jgi:hypothetical protein
MSWIADGGGIRVVFLCLWLGVLGMLPATVSPQRGQNPGSAQKASAKGSSIVFREVEPVVRRKSGVPPGLPRFLPFIEESHPIHAVIQSTTTSGYSILLANAMPCEGANWCLYGTLKGSNEPFSTEANAEKAVPVLLQVGIEATFFDSRCDTYCSQAYIEWQENGCYYSIGIKGPNPMRKTLIKVANSAAEAPVR